MEPPAVLSGICRTNSLLATDKNKQFGLRATLTYSDGSTEHKYVAFNPQLTDWQFVSTAIVPKKALVISSITVDCAYEKNANTAYFDNISLVKEVAQTMRYTYFEGCIPYRGLFYYGFTLIPTESIPEFKMVMQDAAQNQEFAPLLALCQKALASQCCILHCGI